MSRVSFVACSLGVLLAACESDPRMGADWFDDTHARADGEWTHASPDGLPSVAAESYLEAGRYLSVVALCNDCHTHGWLPNADVREEEWLAGSPVGYEGPWGVSFPSNLRLRAQEWTEDQWVEKLRTRRAHDFMPWMAVTVLSDKDARAFYRFLRHLGPYGEHVPAAIPPGEPIGEPYVSLREWPANTTLQAVESD
jgi:hypothetical protein